MNTPLRLDHVVIVVRELDQAIVDAEDAGFTVVPGGRHPGRNTRNALIVFEDGAYLELITYEAPSPDERWWRVLAAHGDGLVDFALLPEDIDATIAAARARGLQGLTGPLPGGRLRPDGAQVQWQTARQSTHDLPFLCADVTPRALRVPEGEVRRHRNGAVAIPSLTVSVENLQATLARYAAFLGDDAIDGEEVVLTGARIHFVEHPHRARGEGPGAIDLRYARSGSGEGRVEPLDVAFLG
jgi:hypothetical protein